MQSATLFDRQRTIGGITDLDPEGREVVALYADAAHPDPIALLVTDYGADATNHRPVRARDLLWLLALSLDLKEVVLQSWFEALGFDGDHPIVEPGISE
ncbi:hypothetical protein OV079_35960 [Nannocystis pusilla]|uniref:Uncharacterized protein n=1 Tax=Nannocystis pusilla TaxID=889268 RepID=A0A9X3J197_9BACT|nr:hypothetical protein [Nannocystis pusilla]MCY1010870.1 hypothetical protein [Nannocystis pusilla]